MNREAQEKQHLIETLYIRERQEKKNTAQGREKRKVWTKTRDIDDEERETEENK